MEETLEWVRLELDAKKERVRQEAREEASQKVEAKYLASGTFGFIRGNCFWEGFEEFWDLAVERFPNIDFIVIGSREIEAKAEEEEEEVNQDAVEAAIGGDQETTTMAVVEVSIVVPRESTPGDVTRDANPKE